MAMNDGQDVVEIVRDTSRKLPDGFQLLGLSQLVLEPPLGGLTRMQGLFSPDALESSAAMVSQALECAQIIVGISLKSVASDRQNADDCCPVANRRKHEGSWRLQLAPCQQAILGGRAEN